MKQILILAIIIKKIPITISEYNSVSEWLLWWVPLPHIGGKPYSYFRASIDLEQYDCFKND
ncbi:MAG: hypothetical protein KZQ83_09310 [gamma proteobacterium symbiont of Taylorina sp.]|nr:hypothetical protein [gamma proteobacterium symbiont of Taylorina sp.]